MDGVTPVTQDERLALRLHEPADAGISSGCWWRTPST